MNIKTVLVFASALGGPFLTVGATVFYRRALEWWYEHEIHVEHEIAVNLSIGVVVMLFMVGGISLLIRAANERTPKQWWWE